MTDKDIHKGLEKKLKAVVCDKLCIENLSGAQSNSSNPLHQQGSTSYLSFVSYRAALKSFGANKVLRCKIVSKSVLKAVIIISLTPDRISMCMRNGLLVAPGLETICHSGKTVQLHHHVHTQPGRPLRSNFFHRNGQGFTVSLYLGFDY